MGTSPSTSMGNLAPCVNMKILAGVTAHVSRNKARAQSDVKPASVKRVTVGLAPDPT